MSIPITLPKIRWNVLVFLGIPSFFLPMLASCQTTANVTDGSGFEMLKPSAATRKFIISNDIDFAKQVVAHNETCAKQSGCRK